MDLECSHSDRLDRGHVWDPGFRFVSQKHEFSTVNVREVLSL